MAKTVQHGRNNEDTAALLTAISADRFHTYLQAAGFNHERALNLYLWNARLGEAFHVPIQAVEVALRNAVNVALSNIFTQNWWASKSLSDLLDEERTADLTMVLRRIRNRNLELRNGQVVAGLSLGFWVGMLAGRYNPPIWGNQLRTAFPYLPPGRSRKSLHRKTGDVATLRNRISHHEPLLGRDALTDFSDMITLLEWICPAKSTWIGPYCRVAQVVRERPR